MSIKQHGGIFGRNPAFNNVEIGGTLTVDQIVEKTGAAGITLDGVTLKDGNVVLADGKGIDFSATASTGTSELLDDYEEGTWTPSVLVGGNPVTPLYAQGRYIKIGQQVIIYMALTNLNTVTAGFSGELTIQGLPYASLFGLTLMRYPGGAKFTNMSVTPIPFIEYNGATTIRTEVQASQITADGADLYSVITYLTA